ncbi:MAG TPA: hypothetical protein VFB58_16450 [Chloroflexota bacterium]|nr:hypothetical protein [Chloroflexota bacterium]
MNQTETRTNLPVSNFVYDVVTILHEKLQGLEALERYTQDAQQGGHNAFVQLAQKIRQQDTEVVQELQKILARNINQS